MRILTRFPQMRVPNYFKDRMNVGKHLKEGLSIKIVITKLTWKKSSAKRFNMVSKFNWCMLTQASTSNMLKECQNLTEIASCSNWRKILTHRGAHLFSHLGTTIVKMVSRSFWMITCWFTTRNIIHMSMCLTKSSSHRRSEISLLLNSDRRLQSEGKTRTKSTKVASQICRVITSNGRSFRTAK